MSEADLILAVSHFKTQAKGEDNIPQNVVAKALPFIPPYLTKLFNTTITKGVFPPS